MLRTKSGLAPEELLLLRPNLLAHWAPLLAHLDSVGLRGRLLRCCCGRAQAAVDLLPGPRQGPAPEHRGDKGRQRPADLRK